MDLASTLFLILAILGVWALVALIFDFVTLLPAVTTTVPFEEVECAGAPLALLPPPADTDLEIPPRPGTHLDETF